MSGAVISANTSLKVNRAISGATTVSANCYAVVTYSMKTDYAAANYNNNAAYYGVGQGQILERYFGPAQSIPATFTVNINFVDGSNAPTSGTVSYTLLSGVEFINSP